MVVARPALHQTSAGKVSINTKVCCILLGVEYAGYGMDHPASDRSDRQLRPRALCLRCKRLESLCACKKQRQRIATATRSRTSQVMGQPPPEVTEEPSKVLVARGRSRSARSTSIPPSHSDDASSCEPPFTELMPSGSSRPPPPAGVEPPPPTSMQLRPHSSRAESTGWYSNLLLDALGKTSSESSVTSSSDSTDSSASSSYESGGLSREGETNVDQPSTPQPSTSQHVPMTDTPKRANVEMIPRKIFPTKKSPRSVRKAGSPTASRGARPARKSPPVSEPGSRARKGAAPPSDVAGTSRASSQKGHVCPECGKAFGSPGKLGQHMFSHTGERPFPCTQCSKAFSSKFKLVRHNLIHSTVRRFVCGTCGRQFHRKDHLQNHAKIHAAVKLKFRCDRVGCNKEYTSANSARKHSAAHAAQDGQLDCTLCGRHFPTTPEVLHHLKVHAGSRAVKTQADRKFTCEVCGRSFFTRKDVRRHFVVHTGLRDFLCQFCPQRFGRKDHLVRHIKKSHQTGWTKIRRKTRRVVSNPSPSETRGAGSSPGPSSARDPSPVSLDLKQEPEDMNIVEVKQEVAPPPQDLQTIPLELPPEIPLYPPPPYPKPPDVLDESYHKPPEDLSQFYSIVPDIHRLFTAESGNGQLLMSIMESVELSTTSRGPEMLPSTSQVLPPALEMMQPVRSVTQRLASTSQALPASLEMMQPVRSVTQRLASTSQALPASLEMMQPVRGVAQRLGQASLELMQPMTQRLSLAEQMMGASMSEADEDLGLCDPSLLVAPDPVSPSTSRAVMDTLLREKGDKDSAPLPRFDQAFPPQ